ncbi:MAG: hypothetical protein JKX81_10085 [Arenicella sp.]|nr:hypothetical protein [Arenicella sp.]
MVIEREKAPLEDLMAAMDVVDTLRHQQRITERELDGEGRRERLLARLRKLYTAQGIDVPDRVLEEGIDALEQERFKYQPVKRSWRTKLAHLWVSRSRWGKPIGFLAVVACVFYGYYFFSVVLPERNLRASLPDKVNSVFSGIVAVAKNSAVIDQAKASSTKAYRAIDQKNYVEAEAVVANMQAVKTQLGLDYRIRVISKPNQNSGVWRNPPNNPGGKNYYLIVEAVDNDNRVLELTIVNQENNKAAVKNSWGLRVNEETFYKVASDKRDDGIIQANTVGKKEVGYLNPVFSIPTSGATITEW